MFNLRKGDALPSLEKLPQRQIIYKRGKGKINGLKNIAI
jgi:hypothetical protein